VYGVVKQSGGEIEVESTPSGGTTFRISLPMAEGEVMASPSRKEAAAESGHETVLLVEDDQALRAVTREILEAAGYRVLAAARPDEALMVSAGQSGPIDLLLTDVVMPGRSGPEVAAELGVHRPGLRVLYISGYPHDAIAHHGVPGGGRRLLHKPFSSSELLQAVRTTLDQPAPQTPAP
jgi:two-component system cell cycle sensor histidine kinase/response regulator CckA